MGAEALEDSACNEKLSRKSVTDKPHPDRHVSLKKTRVFTSCERIQWGKKFHAGRKQLASFWAMV